MKLKGGNGGDYQEERMECLSRDRVYIVDQVFEEVFVELRKIVPALKPKGGQDV